jgi:hypothetical protein
MVNITTRSTPSPTAFGALGKKALFLEEEADVT